MCAHMQGMVFTQLSFFNWETDHNCLSTCIIVRERAASSEGALSTSCHRCLAVEGVEVCLERERERNVYPS